jgi:hypothetical protein
MHVSDIGMMKVTLIIDFDVVKILRSELEYFSPSEVPIGVGFAYMCL